AFTVARSEVEKIVGKEPYFPAALSLLAMIDAGLGRKEEAIREGRRACEQLPISKDAVDGPALAINLAQIYAWTGEKDSAIEQIAAVERVPNALSYGLLKFGPPIGTYCAAIRASRKSLIPSRQNCSRRRWRRPERTSAVSARGYNAERMM